MNHKFSRVKFVKFLQSSLGRGAACCTFLFLSTPVVMASDALGISARIGLPSINSRLLSPSSLADMRGKFVNGSHIVYFGLQMVSSWENELKVSSDISISFNSQGQPVFDISSKSDGISGGGWSFNPESVFPFKNMGGVKQFIQVGGDNNYVANNLNMELGPVGSIIPVVDVTGGSGNPYNAYYKNNSSTAFGGIVVGVNGGISLGISVPGVGSIGQEFGSGGINQYATINNSFLNSAVLNNLTMQIGTEMGSSLYAQHMNMLLQGMAGITP